MIDLLARRSVLFLGGAVALALIAIPFALINDRMLGLMNRWTQSLSTSRRLPRNDAGSG